MMRVIGKRGRWKRVGKGRKNGEDEKKMKEKRERRGKVERKLLGVHSTANYIPLPNANAAQISE